MFSLFPPDLDTALANHHSSKPTTTCDGPPPNLSAEGPAGGIPTAPGRAGAAPSCLERAALQDALGQMQLSGGWPHKLRLKVQHVEVKP